MHRSFLSKLQHSYLWLEFTAFLVASALGTLFHFVYDWTGQQTVIGFFFPVNESAWEHLKLIFFPILLVSIPEYFLIQEKDVKDVFFCIKLKSALLGMLYTIILFYTYRGILGKNVDWINILIYYIAMAIAYSYSYRQLKTGLTKSRPVLCAIIIVDLILMFMIFSVLPPDIELFRAP